jgi:hypothetical protein
LLARERRDMEETHFFSRVCLISAQIRVALLSEIRTERDKKLTIKLIKGMD